ncbi:hypothetical protein KXV52_009576, partial [Aspergillus fumigatus]
MAEVKIEYGDIPGGFRARINPKLDWLIVIRDKPGSSWRDPAQGSTESIPKGEYAVKLHTTLLSLELLDEAKVSSRLETT